MSDYILAVGGTGNKILESAVYLAAADGFRTPEGACVPAIYALSVDVDAACGNTTRAKRAAEHYDSLQTAFSAYPAPHAGFHTAFKAERWSMNLSRRAMSVDRMVENQRRDRLLSRAIFTETESALEYSEGFRGHPDLGVLFFSDLLESLETLRRENQPDEMNALCDRIRSELDRGERVKVALCGSIFGGTGASGIPAIARYLRKLFQQDTERFELAAALMLPYYAVPPSGRDEEAEIVVKSDAFLDKARTALQYYGMEGMIRQNERDENGVFDALYLLGMPPELFVTARLYSTGSQSQENDAHLLEWLAARCVSAFFRTGFRGEDGHRIDCYYYQLHTPVFGWASFDTQEDEYRAAFGGMLKAAALFFAECYPTLARLTKNGDRKCERVNYCAPYFSLARRMGELPRLEELLHKLYGFFSFYAHWMLQLTGAIPPALLEEGADGLFDGECLRALSALLAQYALPQPQRDLKAWEAAALAVQEGLRELVAGKTPDRVGAAQSIAGLGGGRLRGQGAAGMLCSFISALFSAVSEEAGR